jgi:hypothetical protein
MSSFKVAKYDAFGRVIASARVATPDQAHKFLDQISATVAPENAPTHERADRGGFTTKSPGRKSKEQIARELEADEAELRG